MWRVRLITCSSVAPGARTRSPAVPCAARAACPRPGTPTRPRRNNARRRAAPRRPASGTPRGNGRRRIRCARSASRHISSASSKKSATRPAFSSDWFNSSPAAQHLARRARTPRAAPESSPARASGPAALRDMPQYSHISLPSSRWNESTVRVPLIASSRLVMARDVALRRR